jgi:hypothetical protein
MTAVKRAEILRAEDQYRQARHDALSVQGEARVKVTVEELFKEILRQCEEVNASGHQQIRCAMGGERPRECVLTDGNVGMIVFWQDDRSPTELGFLVAREFNDKLNLPSDSRSAVYFRVPEQVCEGRYKPELSRSLELGWQDPGTSGFLSSTDLATRCLLKFLDLIERRNSGKMPPRKRRHVI